MLPLAFILFLQEAAATTTLFNSAQIVLFPGAKQECLDAFDAQLDCDDYVQLLSYDLDKLSLTSTKLTVLCTTACDAGLKALETTVTEACGAYDFPFNGGFMTAIDVVSLYRYKYGLVCLKNIEGHYCLVEEEKWDIDALDRDSKATWPTYTKRIYPNWLDYEDGLPPVEDDEDEDEDEDDDDSWDDSPEQPEFRYNGPKPGVASTDYYMEGIDPEWKGHGWPDMLEYDEYPLEIQCSECFLSQYRHGIESKWGETYDFVSAQVWNNIKRNCNLDWPLKPANDLSKKEKSDLTLIWDNPPCPCEKRISLDGRTRVDYYSLALELRVPSAAISTLNDVLNREISEETVCIPLSCDVTVVREETNAGSFIQAYTNITMTQFRNWNTYIDERTIRKGDVVCVGPPGGTYEPPATTKSPATPTSHITTATPPAPTQSGTAKNCGRYHEAHDSDVCAVIAITNGITFAHFREMNPSINEYCENLMVGLSYCVALVDEPALEA